MTTTFAVADLHGRLDLLEAALAAIAGTGVQGGTIVFLGDYVDRGPHSRQVIERLMAGPTDPAWRWICLRGNHEDMLLAAIEDLGRIDSWLVNGGLSALQSYGAQRGEPPETAIARIPDAHRRWIRGLPRLHVDLHRIYVHAGVDPIRPLEAQDDEDLGWMRYPIDFTGGHGDRHVVHGHTPFEDGPLLYPGRTDLDTYAWYTGRLVVGEFDDTRPGGPVRLIEVG